MKQLLTLSILAAFIAFAQLAHAQQQDTAQDTTSMQNMEMLQDSTMMGMCMNMMKSMKADTTMSGKQGMQGMMKGDKSGMCINMCMKMMDEDENAMPEKNNNSRGNTKMKKSEG